MANDGLRRPTLAKVGQGGHDMPLPSVEQHIPVFNRISNRLAKLMAKDVLPYRSHSDPILWKRREFNQRADYLANVTMDMPISWQKIYPAAGELPYTEANFVIHCDGGRRGAA